MLDENNQGLTHIGFCGISAAVDYLEENYKITKRKESIKMKFKGQKTFKCSYCTATFIFEPMDNQTELQYCPTCGTKNTNPNLIHIFELYNKENN